MDRKDMNEQIEKAPQLEIRDLTVTIRNGKKEFRVVKNVDLQIPEGSIVGLVGESGCGKSMTAKAVNGLLPAAAKITGGEVLWHDGQKTVCLSKLHERELRKYCGGQIGMVFQEPMTALNPLMRVGDQISEVLLLHRLCKSRAEARERSTALLEKVGIAEAARRYDSWPHELSGGMRQRVVIAMAMAAEPRLLIADEPTTALDVTIEAQILKLIRQLCRERNASALIITHNMGVVAQLCDYVYVMYMGTIMERAPTAEIFRNPLHPYTMGLLSSIPRIGKNPEFLQTIPGNLPETGTKFQGCEFCLRCSNDIKKCFFERPQPYRAQEGHFVRCHVKISAM